jgi:hypothetical protein
VAASDAPTKSAKRVFWLHQGAEYVLGIVLVAAATQTPEPLYLALAGGLVILNAAITDGPLGAYRLVGRRLHRVLDWVVVAMLAAGAVMPGPDAVARTVLGAMAIVLGVLAWQTRYGPRRAPTADPASPPSTPAGTKAVSWGRAAGRMAGKSARAVRDRTSQ